MSRPVLIIKIQNRLEGKMKLEVNAPLFLAWNIHNRSVHKNWQKDIVTFTEAADLAFYVARVLGKTKYKVKELWIKDIDKFELKGKKYYL